MMGKHLIAGYRLNAANCFDLAREFPDAQRKLALLDMAAAWLKLAEITEEFGEALPIGAGQSPASDSSCSMGRREGLQQT
jgi:hypothetical protein